MKILSLILVALCLVLAQGFDLGLNNTMNAVTSFISRAFSRDSADDAVVAAPEVEERDSLKEELRQAADNLMSMDMSKMSAGIKQLATTLIEIPQHVANSTP